MGQINLKRYQNETFQKTGQVLLENSGAQMLLKKISEFEALIQFVHGEFYLDTGVTEGMHMRICVYKYL